MHLHYRVLPKESLNLNVAPLVYSFVGGQGTKLKRQTGINPIFRSADLQLVAVVVEVEVVPNIAVHWVLHIAVAVLASVAVHESIKIYKICLLYIVPKCVCLV